MDIFRGKGEIKCQREGGRKKDVYWGLIRKGDEWEARKEKERLTKEAIIMVQNGVRMGGSEK